MKNSGVANVRCGLGCTGKDTPKSQPRQPTKRRGNKAPFLVPREESQAFHRITWSSGFLVHLIRLTTFWQHLRFLLSWHLLYGWSSWINIDQNWQDLCPHRVNCSIVRRIFKVPHDREKGARLNQQAWVSRWPGSRWIFLVPPPRAWLEIKLNWETVTQNYQLRTRWGRHF